MKSALYEALKKFEERLHTAFRGNVSAHRSFRGTRLARPLFVSPESRRESCPRCVVQ
jgi:hypothetical protein